MFSGSGIQDQDDLRVYVNSGWPEINWNSGTAGLAWDRGDPDRERRDEPQRWVVSVPNKLIRCNGAART